MKAQILKIAGVKSEKEFYKKFPSEEAFMKKHGEEFEKAQGGWGSMTPGGSNAWQNQANYYNNQQIQPIGGNLQPAGLSQLPKQLPTAKLPTSQELMGPPKQKKNDGSDMFNKAFNFIGKAKEADKEVQASKDLTKKLQAWAGASDVVLRAKQSNDAIPKPKHQYVTPDDPRFIYNSNELSNTQGRGTDILTGQNGSYIGGNPTEIQNTYAPDNTLFDDLGYEPLENKNKVKAYQGGGGFGNWFGQMNGSLGGDSTGGFMGNFGQSSPFSGMIAGSNNSAQGRQWGQLGSMFGPGVGLVTEQIGTWLDEEPGKQRNATNKIDFNNRMMAQSDNANNITSGLSELGVAKDGGWVSNDWTPQVIAKFGELDAQDYADFAHKDQFRAGGHLKQYTPPSERAMQTYAMGGQLKTHWGGEVNPIAYNPYLPGSGEIGMLSGASHDNGGIGISYTGGEDGYDGIAANGAEMGAQVEAEGGEPIIEMAEGGSINPQTGQPNTSAVIFGNIPFSKKVANATGDESLMSLAKKYDGKTYKSIIKDMAKPQERAAKTKIKASELANKADDTKWGALDLKTAEMMHTGADKTLENYADDIMKLANLQNATQDVKKEASYLKGKNISAEALGKGKIETDYDPITKDAELENPYAKHGAFLRKAQNSATVGDDKDYVSKYGITPWQGNVGKGSKYGKATASGFSAKQWDEVADKLGFKGKGNKEFEEFLLQNKDSSPLIKARHQTLYGKDPWVDPEHFGYGWAANELLLPKPAEIPADTTTKQTTEPHKDTNVIPYKRNKLADFANMISPFIQSNQLPPIDPRQFTKEYMAMAKNTPYAVQAQQYFPELDPVYRVSYEDILNQNTSDFRDVERQVGNNPAALAGLLANKYKSNQAVKGEEFRANQAIEQQIFGGNRGKINQARAANLQLLADQRDKQLEGEAITNKINLEAVGSIADKYLEHEARDREFRAKSALFPNYRYDAAGNIHNQGWYQPNIPQMYGNKASLKQVPVYGPDGKTIDHYELQPYDDTTTETTTAPYQTPGIVAKKKNGGSVVKNAKNSSVVKAFKNL